MLLKQLVTAESHGITESRLADRMWPDTDGDMAMRNLRTNLSRLRKLLGDSEALVMIQGRLMLNAQHCWSDAQGLNNALRRIAEQTESAPVEEIKALLERYPGEFVPDDEGEFVTEYRERMNLHRRQSVEGLAERRQRTGQEGEAAALRRLLASLNGQAGMT